MNGMEKRMPPIAWLQLTDFMTGWVEYELCGRLTVHGRRVVSIQHLSGARDALRMEVCDDMLEPEKVVRTMSANRMSCIIAAITLNKQVAESLYGVKSDDLQLYYPIECPSMALTKYGVLRPWQSDYAFGRKQSSALQRLVREAFWQAVGEFDHKYADRMDGQPYPAVNMIEEFCRQTKTSELHVPAMRREWQRRRKNGQS